MISLARAAALVDDYLPVWVLAAVAAGILAPGLSALTPLSLPLLAIMVGSVSLTLTPAAFRAVDRRALAVALAVQTGMAGLAYAIATLLGVGPALTAGFVVLGAVTPELVTPTMTALADGDTALATAVLVVVGVASLALVPVVVRLFVGDVGVDPTRIVETLAVAVVVPMVAAVAARARFPARIGRHDDLYPSVSALAVVAVIGIVTAANAGVVRDSAGVLVPVGAGAVALNLGGYAAGYVAGRPFDRATRVATTLSVGMRDFAVAAALVAAAGFPPLASLPAVAFGAVEMVTSAALARWFRDRPAPD